MYDSGLDKHNIPIFHRMGLSTVHCPPVTMTVSAMLFSAGSELSVSWLRLWYGVFSEQGYPGDNLYPGQESSCETADWWRVCPKHKHYDRTLKTKQNILCDGHSAREVIERQHKAKQQQHLSNGTSSIKFSYVRPLASSYRLLLDTSSYMGDNHRWENVRRALHRFIHLLPLGTIIRLVDFLSNVIHYI